MGYICARCGKEITAAGLEQLPGVSCPYCGYRILLKSRPPVMKRLKCE
ncbi:MAG: DNA-directed RNA polymerase subunit P [Candidatus Ranarchaeia archaeon]